MYFCLHFFFVQELTSSIADHSLPAYSLVSPNNPHDLTVSLTPELAAPRYLIGNLMFHYLIGLCSLSTTATCSKAPGTVIVPSGSAQPLNSE